MSKLKITHIPSDQTQMMNIPMIKHSLDDIQILTVKDVTDEEIEQLKREVERLRESDHHPTIYLRDCDIDQFKFETRSSNDGYLCPECGHEMIRESQDELVRTYSKFRCDECQIELTKWLSDKETR